MTTRNYFRDGNGQPGTVYPGRIHVCCIKTNTPRLSSFYPLSEASEERDRYGLPSGYPYDCTPTYYALWWIAEAERIVFNAWDHPVSGTYMEPWAEAEAAAVMEEQRQLYNAGIMSSLR